jgi:lipoprotein-releasing system permease protein
LNFEFFIASRIFLKGKANFSRPIVRFGIVSVMLGLAVMVLSVAIVTGFQEQVREKVIGFGAHIQVTGFEVNTSLEAAPVSRDQDFYPFLDTVQGIRHIQVFALKAGIIKTDDQIEGVVLKGVGPDFDWGFFSDKIVEGKKFTATDTATADEVILSRTLARKLKLKAGDPLRMYFINNDELQPRGRKFTISGIYETGLEEFDKLYVLGDINHIRKLNGWTDDKVGGFEVLIEHYNDMDRMGLSVNEVIGYELKAETIKDLHPQIFEWLSLHDMNVIIIIALMVLVAGITMISTLLILILEKTNMIGTLKALGTKNLSVRTIFIINAVYIIGQGLFWGNLLAFGLMLMQLKTGIFKLNQESYYVSEVPVNLELPHFLLINAGTIVVCTLMLVIPTYIITRITPVKAIRFN